AVVWEPPKTSTPPIAKSPLMLTLLHTPSVLTRQLGRYPICPARVESYLSFFGPWLQRSGLQPVSEEVPGDDLALDLRCALVDPGSPDLPIEVLEQVPLLERDRAVHLDGGVDHLLGGLRSKQLGHRRAPAYTLVASVVRLGGRIDECAGGL